ncbi:MAG: hypothetical protein IPO27_16250 [Bacteroidetes bacterium]|nr:hypothetical protein [Bacteroidota bacterium]
MGEGREVTITDLAASKIAEVAWFLENKGLPATAKKFVDDVFIILKVLVLEE